MRRAEAASWTVLLLISFCSALAAAQPPPPPPRPDKSGTDTSKKRPEKVIAFISTYKDEINWLLAEDDGRDRWRPIVDTIVYQVADLRPNCQPGFPGMGGPGAVVPLPGWPAWAQGWVERKCGLLALNPRIEPGSKEVSES